MQKVIYIARIFLSSFHKKLVLIWAITFAVSFGLSMSIGIVQNQLNIQSYYLNKDMQDLAFLVDTETLYYSDAQARSASTRRERTRIEQWPGLCAVYEQTTVEVADRGWILFGYPSGLLNRLHLPTAKRNVQMNSTAGLSSIWLDYRLSSDYDIGDTIRLNFLLGEESSCSREFSIAGFLNKDNVHYDFQSGSSAGSYSADFIEMNPSYIVCVAISDLAFAGDEFDGVKSYAKFLLPETSEVINSWKDIARHQGTGYVSSMDDILENDWKNIDLMSTPILVLCVIMIVLTIIGLIGTQLQLMNLHKQVAFSLAMTGMDWKTWKVSWLSIFCCPLWSVSLIGVSLGNAWKSVILLEDIRFLSPVALVISIVIVLLSVMGIIPTISRWSQIDINEFRRLSE